eukprot:353000-Chlamydomonas_euryale.AAC.3
MSICARAAAQSQSQNYRERTREGWACVRTQTGVTTGGKSQSHSQSCRERTHERHACVERSKAEGFKQRAGRCHKRHAIAHGPEPPHSHPTTPTRT